MPNGMSSVDKSKIHLAPFYGFSPVLKSLRVSCIRPQDSHIFNLVFSFPLLEDLALIGSHLVLGIDFYVPQTDIPPTPSPAFTGSLELNLFTGTGIAACRLLDLPSGLHFRKFTFSWTQEEDIQRAVALVAKCSHTLEYLDATRQYFSAFVLVPSPSL